MTGSPFRGLLFGCLLSAVFWSVVVVLILTGVLLA